MDLNRPRFPEARPARVLVACLPGDCVYAIIVACPGSRSTLTCWSPRCSAPARRTGWSARLFARCRLSAAEREELFDIYLARCRWTRIYFLWRPNLRDESDNHLVELAVA